MEEAKVLLEVIKNFLEERQDVLGRTVDEEKLYELAKKHKVSNFLLYWAKKESKLQRIKTKIEKSFQNQIVKDTNENMEFEKLLAEFEKAKLKTLVVKGFVMKAVYPQDYMRQMCDIDILVEHTDFERATELLKDLGYCRFHDTEHHLVFAKEPYSILELHRKLIFGEEIGHEYFNNEIWKAVVPYQNYANIYQMTKEDAYVFCMTHLIRHFKVGGILIKDVLDVYLYCEKYKESWNQEKLQEKLKCLGIEEFEEVMRKIAYRWFGQKPVSDFDEVERFILEGLKLENQVNFEIGQKGGKSKYLLHLLFPELRLMKKKYPVLEKVPILLPFTWCARLLKEFFSNASHLNERTETIKLIQKANHEEVSRVQEIYQKLGIGGKEE